MNDDLLEAYTLVFEGPNGQAVLADLEARFGFSTRSMYSNDVNALLVNEGSRKVLVHIGNMLALANGPAQPLQEMAE